MENLPSIFLSHSGKQKPEFVTHLYYALLRVHHRPFFDMDTDHSLPIGLDYPSRIFQACEACKIGVIVVTDDYIKNMWPMLELQHLLLPSASPDRRIFPLFYELRPGDLSDAVKLEHWKKCWAEKAPMWEAQMSELTADMPHSGCKFQINLNIGSWPDNLRTLQHRSGEVRGVFYGENERHIFTSDYDYIQKIVSSICIALPPPQTYLLDNAIKGQERIHEEMVKEFEQEAGSTGVDEVRVIGVYGIGGSGKSTVCNIMAKVYSNQFPGRCLHLEFPTDGKTQELLNAVKSVLHTLGEPNVENVSNMKRAMNLLQNGLQIDKVFLALDNIWSNHVEDAKMILSTKWKPGSRILITGRSKRVLERVLDGRVEVEGPSKIVHVPSLSEEEAMEALRSYSCFSCYIPEDSLRSLARSCFFGNHCHALYLRLKGVELREKGRPSFNVQQWKDLMSSLQMDGHHVHAHEGQPREQEALVSEVIEQSVDRLPVHLQEIFINLVTFQNFDLGLQYYYPDPIWATLRLFCDKWCGRTENDMYYDVLALEYHGLVEIHTEYNYGRGDTKKHLLVHDLLRHVVQSRVSRPEYATSAFLRTMKEGVSALVGFQADLEALVGSRFWRALFGSTTFTTHQMRVLRVTVYKNSVYGRFRSLQLGRANLQALRVLTLDSLEKNDGIKEISGWEGVPNLMWLSLRWLNDLKRIAPIGCLKRLERLFFDGCKQLELKSIIGRNHGDRIMRSCLVKVGDQLPKLHTLEFVPNYWQLRLEIGPYLLDAFPALKTLVLVARLLECFNPDVGSGNNSWGSCRDELRSTQQANITSHLGTHSSLHELDIFSICPQNLWASDLRGEFLRISSLLRDDAAGVASDAGGTTVLSLLAGNIIDRHKIKHDCTTPAAAAAAARESNLLGPTICACPVHLFPFLRLTSLSIVIQDPACTRHIRWLDVSGLPRLRFLHLGSFESVEQLFFQSTSLAYAEYYRPASMKEIHIQDFPSLLEISGLGAHYTELSTLKIERCTSLVRISSMQVDINGMDAFPYVDCNNLFSRAVESSGPLLRGNIYGAEGSSGTLL